MALNGGPQFTFSLVISFALNYETREEVDALWEKRSTGEEEQQCLWLKDKFGLSWQIIPTVLVAMLSDTDAMVARRAMTAMLQMKKIDVSLLVRAYKNA